MSAKNSPNEQKRTKIWKSKTYATGAERSLLIGLRIASQLALTFEETTAFLREFANEIGRQKDSKSEEQISLDHCAAAALQKLQQTANTVLA